MAITYTKKYIDDCVNKDYDPDDPYKPVRDLQSFAIAEAEQGNYDYAKVIIDIANQKLKEVEIELAHDLISQQFSTTP